MRDPNRIMEMMTILTAIWLGNPDMRFGQLVINLYSAYIKDKKIYEIEYSYEDPVIYGFEDDEFLVWLKTFKGFNQYGNS
jgi:hypothetical protein